MIKSIIKISIRYLVKQKAYAFINIFGLASFIIAFITISFQSFKAAVAQPVNAIKYE